MTESKDMIIVGAGVISTTVASMFNELVLESIFMNV